MTLHASSADERQTSLLGVAEDFSFALLVFVLCNFGGPNREDRRRRRPSPSAAAASNMFSLTMTAAHMPTADELSAAVAALLQEEKSGELDVKQIHDLLLKDRNWKIPERRLHKFVKRHRGSGASAAKAPSSEATEESSSPVRKATQGVLKKLFQRKSPDPAIKAGGTGVATGAAGDAKPGATVVTDQSPGRISAAASLESSVLPDPRELGGVPSTIVTTTTTTIEETPTGAVADGTNEAVASTTEAVATNTNVDDDAASHESKPCFMLPCEGMGCSIL